jgi:type VI protein secretion system component VasF
MSIYSDFAGALTEFRRGQQDRWYRRHEDPDGPAFIEARTEAYRLRGIALHALFRVQLIASARTLVDAAQEAYALTSTVHKAVDKTEAQALATQAREVVEQFIKLASSDVQ